MIKFGPKPKTGVEKAIDSVLREMEDAHADSAEYSKMTKQLVKLYSLKEIDAPKRVNPNTLVTILGNVAIVGIIVSHERAHVIASKALQFVNRTSN